MRNRDVYAGARRASKLLLESMGPDELASSGSSRSVSSTTPIRHTPLGTNIRARPRRSTRALFRVACKMLCRRRGCAVEAKGRWKTRMEMPLQSSMGFYGGKALWMDCCVFMSVIQKAGPDFIGLSLATTTAITAGLVSLSGYAHF